ncbi:AraC family transcriptional activator FtrA [Pseudomonas sp. JUb42]|jgi:AraC family transcriptional activator FtrA|uniref:transcriptional regulator FtrA n=1 Tax=Pseudomonas sp. JUb42 TaxID=2940611 RepID=UPI0021693F0C|nr:transcriptional regulator FtrA [Pseudomonas sp. JUb42]MCS3470969.1 AraC family transcriptional activator FtrA [Pseudomonas sp. JUb42]
MHDNPGLVAVLAYDGLCTFEFGIAVEIFGLPRPEFDFPWYSHSIVAVDEGPMRASGGMAISADAGLAELVNARTIVVPGWRNRLEAPPQALLTALRSAHERGARIISICSGVFVLAAAGLLDGKRATTHWRYTEELQARFPAIDVDADVLYVDNGQVITSAGSAAGIDACLHLVSRDYGTHVANTVARRLVMAPQRSGGQAQFIPAPVARTPRDGLAQVLEWARQNAGVALTVKQLAAKALMSERTFLRRFVEATGMTPKAWLLQARMSLARDLLESTQLNGEEISARCGFTSSESFRVAFRKAAGLPPTAYRERFGSSRQT